MQNIFQRLLPSDHALPDGVVSVVTVLDSPKPELYTYVDGHIVVSSGLIYGLENEARLAGLLALQVAHLSQAGAQGI